MSLLSMAIQPRAKFVQAILTSTLFVCLGAAIALLQIQCAVAARRSTTVTSPSSVMGTSGSLESQTYNSSASVVSCVWLFVTIFIASSVRGKLPQLTLPTIQYSIFSIVASIYAPQFPNMSAGVQFVVRLLTTFLTGFALATGVSLFIFPVTSRENATKQMTGLLALMKICITSHGNYMHNVTTSHMSSTEDSRDNDNLVTGEPEIKEGQSEKRPDPEIATQKKVFQDMGALFGKLKLEIGFAKKEIAYGKLVAEDYSKLFRLLQDILLPMIGFSAFINIMQSVKDHSEDNDESRNMFSTRETLNAVLHLETDEWDEIMAMSHEKFVKFQQALKDGLTHVSYVLELTPRPKVNKHDVEKAAGSPLDPGDKGFASWFRTEINQYHEHRLTAIQRWCEKKGIELPASFWNNPRAHYSLKDIQISRQSTQQRQNQQQLYLLLYVEYLVHSLGNAILDTVHFADSKLVDGTMERRRIVFPGWRRLVKLLHDSYRQVDTEQVIPDGQNPSTSIWVGDSLKKRKDPEHLPPSNAYERMTNHLRIIPQFFASPAASYAFRAAIATVSLGILAFLHQTYAFFLQQRGFWAIIMTAISMGAHTGQGVFGFVARAAGTTVAMVASIIIWYIGYKQPAAIIPIFFFYLTGGILFILKNPTLTMVGLISMVTVVLIIGYELQEIRIGLTLTESNGQIFYPIYILAPIRLASVVAGLAVAFFWTYIPYPVTTHSTMRTDMGKTLYLLGNFYSCVHTTVETRIQLGSKAKNYTKSSPLYKLDKARRKTFEKLIVMLNLLREHSRFTRFEPPFGGKFPKETYDDLIRSLQTLFNYVALISFSTNAFMDEEGEESAWIADFRRFASDIKVTSHDLTSTLCLISASVLNKQPLPPYLKIPQSFELATRMHAIDPQLLSIKHVSEPCYAAFAVLEIASSLVTKEMEHIVKLVRTLVGEVDFSFHVISTEEHSSVNTLWDNHDNHESTKLD